MTVVAALLVENTDANPEFAETYPRGGVGRHRCEPSTVRDGRNEMGGHARTRLEPVGYAQDETTSQHELQIAENFSR